MSDAHGPSFNIDDIVQDINGRCEATHFLHLQDCLSTCNYYTDSTFSDIHCDTNNTFSHLSLNCRSLPKKIDKLECSLKSLNYKFDCICLTETWLKEMESTDIYNMNGYTFLSKPRTNKRGGGVGMFVSSGLNFKLRDDLHMNSAICGFESLFIEVKIQKNDIIVGTIYKPPDTSTVDFNVHVNDLFRTISQESKKCIIMADFNIDLLTTDTNHQTADFIHNMFTHTFCPTISKPTRITNYSATLIDNNYNNQHS